MPFKTVLSISLTVLCGLHSAHCFSEKNSANQDPTNNAAGLKQSLAAELQVLADDEQEDGPQSQLKNVIDGISSLTDRLFQQRKSQRTLNEAVKTTELEMGELAKQLRNLKRDQQQLADRIDTLVTKQQQLQEQLQSQHHLIAEQLKAVHQNPRNSALQQLLEQKDPALWDRQLTYLSYINDARSELIKSYQSTISSQLKVSTAIEKERNQKQKNAQMLAVKNDRLNLLQDRRHAELLKLARGINSDEEKITQLHADRATLQQLIDDISIEEERLPTSTLPTQTKISSTAPNAEASIMPATDFAQAKGALSWPVEGQHRFRFGAKRANSDIKWQGETIVATSGSEVKAIHSGRVIFADWLKGQGLLIIIDHGEGYMSLYAHNESLLYDVGSWVEGSESIATVGNSGGQTLAALYFEIRHRGVPANPRKWCRQQS